MTEITQELKTLKSKLKLIKKQGKTTVVAIAVSKNEDNIPLRIKCKGIPIDGYFFDANNDCYIVSGVDFLFLEEIPFIVSLSLEGYNLWNVNCPLSEKIILKNLSKEKIEELNLFLNNFKNCNISYIQYTQENA